MKGVDEINMGKINPKTSMLLDVQYIKPNRSKNQDDHLYIIWKDIVTEEKHLEIVKEPKMKIYFEKPEYRNHRHIRKYAKLDEVEEKVVKYKDILFSIADDIGPAGKNMLSDAYKTRDFKKAKELYLYPYVYGADYDIRAWYRLQWLLGNECTEQKITHGFSDIEVDGYETVGLPTPEFNPVDLITVIDESKKESYTFALIGVDCVEKDMTHMDAIDRAKEEKRRRHYANRMEKQNYYSTHIDELKKEAHDMFDESYPGYEYNFYFYTDERQMIVHYFELLNKLKLDFIGWWNMRFDIPYLIERAKVLGLNPEQFMCHQDFPVKECWFKEDTRNFEIKDQADAFHLSSYTHHYCQMRTYAAIRKGSGELRRNNLNYIAQREIGDEKLNYTDFGNIKTVSYVNYLKYILYNIKDVLLQCGIEKATNDLQTYYITSYQNITPYEQEFKPTILLWNVFYLFLFKDKMVPGENANMFVDYDGKKVTFEGALVGNPDLIGKFGVIYLGEKSSSIFKFSIDMDMTAFYPSTIIEFNIDASTLIFKVIVPGSQYQPRGGDLPFNGITDVQLVAKNTDNFLKEDVAKEIFDNYQTGNNLFTGNKWLNLPSFDMLEKALIKKKLIPEVEF